MRFTATSQSVSLMEKGKQKGGAWGVGDRQGDPMCLWRQVDRKRKAPRWAPWQSFTSAEWTDRGAGRPMERGRGTGRHGGQGDRESGGHGDRAMRHGDKVRDGEEQDREIVYPRLG